MNIFSLLIRDGLLCLFNNKNDNKPHMYIQLGGEECVGCRRIQNLDRDHCIEVIQDKKTSVVLSAASDSEVSDWLLSLCQAVSEGKQVSGLT